MEYNQLIIAALSATMVMVFPLLAGLGFAMFLFPVVVMLKWVFSLKITGNKAESEPPHPRCDPPHL